MALKARLDSNSKSKSHLSLKQAENEESADPDISTIVRERFLSHGREWDSPDLPCLRALLHLAQGMSAHCSVHLHKAVAAIFFSFFSFLKTLLNLK